VDTLFSIVGVILLISIQFYLLAKYLNTVSSELSNFFTSISADDFQNTRIDSKIIARHGDLYHALDKLKKQIKEQRSELELNELLLTSFLDHVDTAIILFQASGQIIWLNNTALDILQMPRFYSIVDLWKSYPELETQFKQTYPGERKIYKLNNGTEELTLSLRKSEFITKDNTLSLFALDHISKEYSEIEQESWERLIKVISHEIMNTLTPVTALIESLKKDFSEHNRDKNYLKFTERSLHIIEERSKGLLHFVNRYKSITSTPAPKCTPMNAGELLMEVKQLALQEHKDIIEISLKTNDLELFADKDLITQALLNLVKNSMYAVEGKEDGKITLEVLKEDNKMIINVSDNGVGINDKFIDKIFIPFFTTRKNGSGIGLSLSRQIMRLHGGNIKVYSVPDLRTTISLIF
jgi:nitrogen fixation/metabolism regulation signal transduction histidine kinase